MRLFDGDTILLCSDGLHDMIDDEKIAAILKRATDSAQACESLVTAALDSGGKDNVTVVVARYRIPEVD
jgi:protein phosphatase